jgi:hypothetical protein
MTSQYMADRTNQQRLFLGCFLALVATDQAGRTDRGKFSQNA